MNDPLCKNPKNTVAVYVTKEKKKRNKYGEFTSLQLVSLFFKPMDFPCSSSKETVSFLCRGFSQGDFNVLLSFAIRRSSFVCSTYPREATFQKTLVLLYETAAFCNYRYNNDT
jgi:hypothetical protein